MDLLDEPIAEINLTNSCIMRTLTIFGQKSTDPVCNVASMLKSAIITAILKKLGANLAISITLDPPLIYIFFPKS